MQPSASLLSLHIIIGCVVGSSLLEMDMFPHRLLNTQLEKVVLITTGSTLTKLLVSQHHASTLLEWCFTLLLLFSSPVPPSNT